MPSANETIAILDRHFDSAFTDQLSKLREEYKRDDYFELSPFLPGIIHKVALEELEMLFDSNGRRRDLIIAASGNTPRKYTNLDRDSLATHCSIIPDVYKSAGLYRLLSEIVGEPVLPVPYLPEEYIASRLHQANDEHGWHWDDYTWALVCIFKAPPPDSGGSLEYLPRIPWNRQNPQVEQYVQAGPLLHRHPAVGSAYFLKADSSLHRVAPLTKNAERMIVCYSFSTKEGAVLDVDHSSMEALYPESHTSHYG